MCSSTRARVGWGVAGGAILILLGSLTLTLVPSVVDRAVLDNDWLGYNVVNGTRTLNDMTVSWQRPAYDMRMHIWIYDVLNAAEVMLGGKPRVRQVGPFVFIEKQEKAFNFTRNDTRVLYRNNHLYFFNSTLSCPECRLDRNVTIPNVIFQKLSDMADQGFLQKLAVEAVLTAFNRESVFITVSAGEALYDGYHDPIIDAICDKPLLRVLCQGGQIPKRIGFFYGQNNTDDGVYEVSTGQGEPWNIGKVFTWNNLTKVADAVWDGPHAGMVNGTDGQLFAPMLKQTDSLHIFAAPICRSIVMEYTGESIFEDVPAYRFAIPASMYDPSIAQNREFCNVKDTPTFFNSTIQIAGCLPTGLLDVGRCQPGAPRIYISQAHFLNTPKEVREAVIGIEEPSSENDVTFVDIEPTSGVPIRAKRAMQINLGMVKGNLNMMANFTNVIMPVLWMNETAEFDPATRSQLKDQLLFAKHAAFVSGVCLVTLGGLIWVALATFVIVVTVSQPPAEDERAILEEAAEDDEEVAAAQDAD